MTTPMTAYADQAQPGFGLTAVGVAAMVVAALGTVIFAPQDVVDPPSSDTCQMELATGADWTGSGCTAPVRTVASTR